MSQSRAHSRHESTDAATDITWNIAMSDSIELQNGTLSQNQTETYWQQGFLFPVSAMTLQKADAYRAERKRSRQNRLTTACHSP
ncbi:MAG: hypothetical protein ACU0C9_07050 [Paracoccaceae bacterium]